MILTANGVQFTLHVDHRLSKKTPTGAKRADKPYTIVRLHAGKCENDLAHEAPDFVQTEGKAITYNGRDEWGKLMDSPVKRIGRKIAFQRAVEAYFPVVDIGHPDYTENRTMRTQLWVDYWKQAPLPQSPLRLAKLYKQARALAREEAEIFAGRKKATREEGHAITRRLDIILGVVPRV